MRNGNWNWVRCGDGYCIFTVPYYNKSLLIKDGRIKGYMNRYIKKYKNSLPAFYWEKIKNKKNPIQVNNTNIIIDGILSATEKGELSKQKDKVKDAFLVHGRPSSVRRVVKTDSDDWTLQWEDIRFYDGYYIFHPNLEGKTVIRTIEPLKVLNFRCKKSFNYIIKYFKARLPKITYHITSDYRIELDNKPKFESVLVDLAKEQTRTQKEVKIEHNVRRIHRLGFSEAVERSKTLTAEDFKRYKSKFIDFLADHQAIDRKIVPATESISHSSGSFDEECFMFTIESFSGNLIVVVENVNPDRATILFEVGRGSYMLSLHTIYDYIQSDRINKRSTIRGNDVRFRDAGVICYDTFKHDQFHDWKIRIQKWFR